MFIITVFTVCWCGIQQISVFFALSSETKDDCRCRWPLTSASEAKTWEEAADLLQLCGEYFLFKVELFTDPTAEICVIAQINQNQQNHSHPAKI